jgi:hypothetical protein
MLFWKSKKKDEAAESESGKKANPSNPPNSANPRVS